MAGDQDMGLITFRGFLAGTVGSVVIGSLVAAVVFLL
jgi:hypothetical protein